MDQKITIAPPTAPYPGPNLVDDRFRVFNDLAVSLRTEASPATVRTMAERLFALVDEGIDRLPLGVRNDIVETLARVRPASSESLVPEIDRRSRLLEEVTEREIAPFRDALRAGRLSSSELDTELKRRADGRTTFSFAYDDADHFFDRLIGLDPRRVEAARLTAGAVMYQPTPISLIRHWLEKHPLTASDTLYDLGCGVGRVVAAAALLTPARIKGVEYAASYVDEARRILTENRIPRASIIQSDIRKVDLSEASHFYLFNPFEKDLMKIVGKKIENAARRSEVTVAALGACQSYFDASRSFTSVSSLATDIMHVVVYRSAGSGRR